MYITKNFYPLPTFGSFKVEIFYVLHPLIWTVEDEDPTILQNDIPNFYHVG